MFPAPNILDCMIITTTIADYSYKHNNDKGEEWATNLYYKNADKW